MLKIVHFRELKIPFHWKPFYFHFSACFTTFFIEKHLTIAIFKRFLNNFQEYLIPIRLKLILLWRKNQK